MTGPADRGAGEGADGFRDAPFSPHRDDDAIRLSARRQSPPAAFDRTVGRAAVIVTAVSLLVFAGALAAGWLLRPPAPASLPAPAVAALTEPRPAATASAVTAPAILDTPTVARPARPTEVCAALVRAGFPATPWKPSAIGGNGFECAVGPLDVHGEQASDGRSSSLFLLLRGAKADRVDELLFKVGIMAPGDCAAMARSSRRLIETLGAFPALAVPQSVMAHLGASEPFELAAGTSSFSIGPDFGDARRVTLRAAFDAQTPARAKPARPVAAPTRVASLCADLDR